MSDENLEAEESQEEEIIEEQEAIDEESDESLNVSQMAEYQNQIAELNDKLLRSVAENENLKRRTEREKADALRYRANRLALKALNYANSIAWQGMDRNSLYHRRMAIDRED